MALSSLLRCVPSPSHAVRVATAANSTVIPAASQTSRIPREDPALRYGAAKKVLFEENI